MKHAVCRAIGNGISRSDHRSRVQVLRARARCAQRERFDAILIGCGADLITRSRRGS
jgi:hypothetical protein